MPGREQQQDLGACGSAKALLALQTGERGVLLHLVLFPGCPSQRTTHQDRLMNQSWDRRDISTGHLHAMGSQTPGLVPAPQDGASYLLALLLCLFEMLHG